MIMLKDKLALVTGGGRGIGAAIAEGLAGAGAKVVVADRDLAVAEAVAEAIRGKGGAAHALPVDVADRASVQDLARRLGDIGPVDILINNAGIAPGSTILGADAEACWDQTLGVNLTGMFNVTRALVPDLARTRGCVVNLASIASFVTSRSSVAYAASKGGVRSLTIALACELAPQGIRVNAVAPGVVDTPMERESIAEAEAGGGHWFRLRAPLGRMGAPQDIVGPVLFYASPLSNFVTGTVLPVDGGFLVS